MEKQDHSQEDDHSWAWPTWLKLRWLRARLVAIETRLRWLQQARGRSWRSHNRLRQLAQAAAATSLAISLLLTPQAPAWAAGAAFTEQTGASNPFDGVDVGLGSTPGFVDINADGDMDAFIGADDGTINFYENTGTALAPTFTQQTGAANPFNGVDVGQKSVASFVDVNGDGDMDAFIGTNDGSILFYENTGTALVPTFTEQTGASNPFNGVDVGDSSTPSFVDVDADGDMDAFLGVLSGSILFYENTGTPLAPIFSEQTGAANPFDGVDVGDSSAPGFVDVDADSDLDAFIGENDGTILFYKNTGTPLVPVFTVQTGAANPFDGVDVGAGSTPAFVDVDADGDMDAFFGESDGVINFYQNTGDNTVVSALRIRTGAANPFTGLDAGSFNAPAFVDIDGDGDIDVFSGSSTGAILYYRNTGTALAPTFSEQTGAANPFNGVDVGTYSLPTFADIDGDGDMDAFIGETSGLFFYYRNTGTPLAPTFSQQTGAANPFNGIDVGSYSAPAFVDIDGDGDLDAFSGTQPGTFKYYRNTGTALAPAFSEQTGAANPLNGQDVGNFSTPIFVDIDGDGDMDVFSGDTVGTFKYFRNTGTALAPTFAQQTGTANPLNGQDVGDAGSVPAFADIDGDGDQDAFSGGSDGVIFYYRNTHCSFSSEVGSSLSAGSVFHFGNGESRLTVTVVDVGTPPLNEITASCTASNHPNAITGLQNNVFWTLTPNAGAGSTTPFSLTLEFPFKSSDADDKICRYTGSAWDCSQSSFTGTSIIRTGVSQLSDWTTGENLTPTAVDIVDFSSEANWLGGPKLAWETADETGLSGFHIWQGSADQAETRLTSTPIGSNGSFGGSRYTWQDGVRFGWGQRVYYWLEAVGPQGSTFIGPVEVQGIGWIFLPSVAR